MNKTKNPKPKPPAKPTDLALCEHAIREMLKEVQKLKADGRAKPAFLASALSRSVRDAARLFQNEYGKPILEQALGTENATRTD